MEGTRAHLEALGQRLRRHRLDLDWTQAQLAHEAGVSRPTVERLEGGASVQLANLVKVLIALGLDDGLRLLVPDPLPSPLELLDRDGARRQRASGDTVPGEAPLPEGWTWGEDP